MLSQSLASVLFLIVLSHAPSAPPPNNMGEPAALIERRVATESGVPAALQLDYADVERLQSSRVTALRRSRLPSQATLFLAASPCYSRQALLAEFPNTKFERVTAIPTHAHHLSMLMLIRQMPAGEQLLVTAWFDAADAFTCANALSFKLARQPSQQD